MPSTTRAGTTRARDAAAPGPWTSLLLGGLLPCAVSAPFVALGGYLFAGLTGLTSALFGLALGTAFFVVGLGALWVVLRSPLALHLVGALAVYGIQVLALFALIDVIGDVGGLSGRAFAVGGLIAALAWQVGQAIVVFRRRATLDVAMPGEEPR